MVRRREIRNFAKMRRRYLYRFTRLTSALGHIEPTKGARCARARPRPRCGGADRDTRLGPAARRGVRGARAVRRAARRARTRGSRYGRRR
eukprot:5477972-Prymnesium_polylepis.2